MMAALNVQAALTLASGCDAVKSIVAAAVLVLVIAGLAHATEARAVSAEHRTGLCDGLRATHTLDPLQTIIVYAAMAITAVPRSQRWCGRNSPAPNHDIWVSRCINRASI